MARIDHGDITEMRRLELRLTVLHQVRDTLYADIECEVAAEDQEARYEANEKLNEVLREIGEVESELDVVGGFNGE